MQRRLTRYAISCCVDSLYNCCNKEIISSEAYFYYLTSTTSKDWLHWLRNFENFLTVLALPREGLDHLLVLTNYVSTKIFEYIKHCLIYDEAIGVLKTQNINPPLKYLPVTCWLLDGRKVERSWMCFFRR